MEACRSTCWVPTEFGILALNTHLLDIGIAYTACRSWTKQNSLNR